MKKGTPTKGHLDPAIVDRKIRALEMRRGGATFEKIAAELGYYDKAAAYKAVETGLRTTLRETASDLRILEVQRLDELTAAFWPKAIAGDCHAADRVVSFMKRRSEVLGLDAPSRAQVDMITKGYDVINSPMELYPANGNGNGNGRHQD